MPIEKAGEWLKLINSAPPQFKAILTWLFWILVCLTLIYAILRIVLGSKFKELYLHIKYVGNLAKRGVKAAGKGVLEALEPPQPYPRVARFFTIVFMLNSYCLFVYFLALCLLTVGLSVYSNVTPAKHMLGALFAIVFAGLAWITFNQAERDRLGLRGTTS